MLDLKARAQGLAAATPEHAEGLAALPSVSRPSTRSSAARAPKRVAATPRPVYPVA